MANIICPRCGAELPAGSLSCEVCGASLDSEFDTCPDCGTPVKKGSLFCSECGAKVNDPPAPVGDFSFIEAARSESIEAPAPVSAPAPETPAAEPVYEQEPAIVQAPVAPEEPPSVPKGRTPPPPQPEIRAVPPIAPLPVENGRRRTPPPPQTPYPPTGFARNAQPPKGSRYAPISTWGYIGIILLFSIPVIGWIFCLVWACGGCTKINKRNLARSYILLFVIVVLVLAIIGALLYFFAYAWIEPYINMILTLQLSPV